MSNADLLGTTVIGPTVPTSFVTDAGTATPAANILDVVTVADDGIATSGAGAVVTITTANDLAAIEALNGTGIPTRTGVETWTINQVVENEILIGDAGATIQSVGLTDGQLLIGVTGDAPVAGSLSSPDNSITITQGAGTIELIVADPSEDYTITGDTGGALSAVAANFNIVGGPGVTTTGAGNTLTINSVVFTNRALNDAVPRDSGSFSTAAITLTLPAAPLQGELCIFVASTADQLVVQAAGAQVINLGNVASSAGGTATSTAKGDSLTLRYQASSNDWFATASIGVWNLA